MGQGFLLANLDKKEYINPHACGCGYKQWEICANYGFANLGMYLMTMGDDDGGAKRGLWAGDHVVLVGDYDKSELYGKVKGRRKNSRTGEWEDYNSGWKDISAKAMKEYNKFIEDQSLKLEIPDYMKHQYPQKVMRTPGKSGWYKDSARHSLAARGLKMRRK